MIVNGLNQETPSRGSMICPTIYIYIYTKKNVSVWWFQTCFIFHFIYGIILPIGSYFSRWFFNHQPDMYINYVNSSSTPKQIITMIALGNMFRKIIMINHEFSTLLWRTKMTIAYKVAPHRLCLLV